MSEAVAGRAVAERTVTIRRIGREALPVAIIDDFDPDPDALRAAATAARFDAAGRHYPGLRAALPTGYLGRHAALLQQVARDQFDAPDLRVLDASFSIVTTAPDALSVVQRLPHIDAVQPGRLALVHFLAPGDGDGTAFFRHRSTGFESLDEARSTVYLPRLEAEVTTLPATCGYAGADHPLFEQLDVISAVYNRAILYRSAALHSGAITAGRDLPANPRNGRLTITGFFAS